MPEAPPAAMDGGPSFTTTEAPGSRLQIQPPEETAAAAAAATAQPMDAPLAPASHYPWRRHWWPVTSEEMLHKDRPQVGVGGMHKDRPQVTGGMRPQVRGECAYMDRPHLCNECVPHSYCRPSPSSAWNWWCGGARRRASGSSCATAAPTGEGEVGERRAVSAQIMYTGRWGRERRFLHRSCTHRGVGELPGSFP